jgi:tetratricopeptide (TPR) repeat protein
MYAMKSIFRFALSCLLALSAVTTLSFAVTPDFKDELEVILHDFDAATYDASNDEARVKAYEAIRTRAAALAARNPDRAEPIVWQAWALMSKAGVLRTFSAMGMMNEARDKLEAASAIPTNTYAAATFSSLGGMYANAPGFPMSFGDKKKALANYQRAIALSPTAIEANFQFAKFLFDSGDYAGALKHATVSVNAPPRPGREKADKNFHAKAETLMAQVKTKLQ